MNDRRYRVAVILLKRSSPLPLDLIAYLTTIGIDVPALERRYAA